MKQSFQKLYKLAFCKLFFFFILFFSNVYLTIKGSTTNISIEDFYTFPAEDTDNTMLGFGWFKNGFGLEDSSTSCTFDSVFPVSGDVYLNGGDLYLAADLIFNNMIDWHTSGNIYGDQYRIDFCPSVQELGSVTYGQMFDNTTITINSDLIVSGTVRFSGECFFNGNGKRILLADTGYLFIDSGATVTFKDVYIDGITEGKICCLDDSTKLTLDDVRWIQDGDYYFTQGSLKIFNNVDFTGSYTFFYQSSQTSTIDTHSFWNFYQGIRFAIGRKNGVTDSEPLYFEDETSVLKLENCCLMVTSSGVRFTRGLMILDRGVEIEVNSTDSTNGLIVGDGTDIGNMSFRFHPGARILFSKGHIVYDNTDPCSFRSRSGEATFVRTSQSIFYLNRDVQLDGLILDTDPNSKLHIADDKNLDYSNCRVLFPGVEFELGGTRYNDYTNLLKGNDEIFLVRGTLTSYTYIQSSNNTLHGNGDISGKIILQDDSADLILNMNGVFANDIELHGGTITFGHDVKFSQDAIFTGSGTINVSEYSLELGSDELTLTNSLLWIGNGGKICLNSQVSLSAVWTFSGDCVIDGDDQTLVLQPGGALVVAPGSSLKIRKLCIEGIQENNIRCLDAQGSICLDDMTWIQDGHYSFTQGSLCFHNQVDFIGDYTFTYESINTSTLQANSEWHVADGIKIILGRNGGVEPLHMEDSTSMLHLDNCTLSSNEQGACFTNGTMLCHHKVILDISSTDSTNGIVLGDGTADHDVFLIIEAGASVHFLRGHLVYNLTQDDALAARGGGSRLIRYADTNFYINEDITLSNVTVVDRNYSAAMIVADGKTVSYDNATFEWPGVGIEMTGYRYNYYTNLLAGNNELFLLNGTLPAVILVQNGGNLVHGGGSLAQQIVLSDSEAAVQFKLNGPLIESVVLNGGTVTLLKELMFNQGYKFVGSGTVELGEHNLLLGPIDQSWAGDIYWDGNSSQIDLHSKIELSGTWTFSGSCTLMGNGNILDLSLGGEIAVDKGSTLSIKDLTVKGISGNNIRCNDSSASINISNILWIQDGYYSFTTGYLEINNDFYLEGNNVFAYQSAQTSTVKKYGRIVFDKGMTFSFDPIWDESLSGSWEQARNFFAFEDRTSILELKNATLHVTLTGMKLTKGILRVKGNSYVVSELDGKFHMEEGLIIGNNNLADDMKCELNSGVIFEVISGAFSYKNVQDTSWDMFNELSMLSIASAAKLKLHQTLTINRGIVQFQPESILCRASGKNLLGPVHVGGAILYEVCYN